MIVQIDVRRPRFAGNASSQALLPGDRGVKTTRYFDEQVLRKRPYIQRQWCEDVLKAPLRREVQMDGRIRWWGRITVPGEARSRYIRVITLPDGETVHNAFFDRNFREAVR
jgi:hypothetical protein